jgi:rSAM/selenodomain-associated transferase 1
MTHAACMLASLDGERRPRVSLALIVLAKAPRAGRSKTRLCPPCTPDEAAALARAALADTLAAVLATPAARRVLVLDGPVGDWLPVGFEVVPQRGDGLDERLANAFADVGGPALLVGMDTPQLMPGNLSTGLERLMTPATDAVLGPAPDGGYWAVGLRSADPRAFLGVPMSTAHTGRAQLARLRSLGLRVAQLPALRDVDRIADARAVAALAPTGRFAQALALTGAA